MAVHTCADGRAHDKFTSRRLLLHRGDTIVLPASQLRLSAQWHPRGAVCLTRAGTMREHCCIRLQMHYITRTAFGCVQGFIAEFAWPGTCDWSPWLAVPAALAVLHRIGLDRLRQHNASLLQTAVAGLCAACDTDLVLGMPCSFGLCPAPMLALGSFAVTEAEQRPSL